MSSYDEEVTSLSKKVQQQSSKQASRRTVLKSGSIGMLSAAAIAAGSSSLLTTSTHAHPNVNYSLQGSWNSLVKVGTDADGYIIPLLAALYAFTNGGTLLQSTQELKGYATSTGPGFGVWTDSAAKDGTASYTLMKQNFDQQGNYLGTITITENIKLSADGNSYTGTGTLQTTDPNAVNDHETFSSQGTRITGSTSQS